MNEKRENTNKKVKKMFETLVLRISGIQKKSELKNIY